MWRVVIEKCVTVVWLKQFSVARCVTCCYWKGCIDKELALEFKKDIVSSYALEKRTPMHARHVDERGVMTIWILISGGDGVSTSVVSVHKVTLGSDATFVGSRCDWPGDICSVYAQQCILNSRWRHAITTWWLKMKKGCVLFSSSQKLLSIDVYFQGRCLLRVTADPLIWAAGETQS